MDYARNLLDNIKSELYLKSEINILVDNSNFLHLLKDILYNS